MLELVCFNEFLKFLKCCKKRAPNYSNTEKNVLLNIVLSYKSIIENRKSDSMTWKEKKEAGTKIVGKVSLKKYYKNIKKTVRKDAAVEKRELKVLVKVSLM